MTVANVDPGFPAVSVPGETRGAAPEGGVPAVAPGEDTPAGEDAAKDLPRIEGGLNRSNPGDVPKSLEAHTVLSSSCST